MTEETNIHPMLSNEREQVGTQAAQEQEEQLAINFLEALRIHAKDRFDKPKFALYKDGIGFAPLGNIMAICSEAKNGKSWLMLQFAIAILRGEFCGMTCDMDDPKVMYFDTEQDKYDTKMVLNRVHYMCGWDFEQDNDRFMLYSMDDFDKVYPDKGIHENRRLLISKAVEYYKPNVVFIDGVRDLIHDFNDLGESADLVQQMMSMSRRLGCLVCMVLHVNPNSEKMRGHLGTEMQNKTTDVFSVKKDDEQDPVQFKVKQVAARHMDIKGWTFAISNEGKFPVPYILMDENTSAAEANAANGNEDDKVRMMLNAAIGQGESLKFTTLRERIRTDNHIGSGRAKEVINRGVTLGLLSCADNTYTRLDTTTIFDNANSMGDDTGDPFA